MTFRLKLIISLIALLIPLLAYNIYDRYQQYTADLNTAASQQANTALMMAQSTDVFMERTITLQQSVGQSIIQLRSDDCTACDAYMQSVLDTSRYARGYAFADTTGRIIYAAPRSLVGKNISDTPYFSSIQAGKRWVVSESPIPLDQESSGVDVASGVYGANDNLAGIVVTIIDEDEMLSALHLRISPQTLFVLVNKSGRVAITSGEIGLPLRERQWQNYSFVQSALRGQSETVQRLEIPSVPVLTGAMAPVESIGWAAGVFVPYDRVVAPVIRGTVIDLLLILFALVLTFILGSILARQLIVPVDDLSNTAEQFSQGNYQARAPIPNTMELATLATTMNSMAESIQQRSRELHQAYERERRIASVLQQSMLPQVPDRYDRLKIATGYFPASEEAELGGDFYDVMMLPDGLIGFVIADVSGKGLSAAVHTATAKYMLEGYAHETPDPAIVLTKLNKSMSWYQLDKDKEKFVTLFFGIIDPKTGCMRYANAGHPPPLIKHENGLAEWINKVPGLPLGITIESQYESSHVHLVENDVLIFYTDGIIEAHKEDEWFGSENLAKLVSSVDLPPDDLVNNIYKAASDFIGGRIPDDVALVVVKLESL